MVAGSSGRLAVVAKMGSSRGGLKPPPVDGGRRVNLTQWSPGGLGPKKVQTTPDYSSLRRQSIWFLSGDPLGTSRGGPWAQAVVV
jgi:hypothetical protein